ncbi:reductase [Fusarium agapanthi]|uniref:Reductase n=1 Tax=Fusarium agapanthi TaxID=1803897 RepID=A0A9P5E4T9_9HYPO|nr:reductase [Fusarium agapanthi]
MMNCHKEPEFQIRDIPSLRGYIASRSSERHWTSKPSFVNCQGLAMIWITLASLGNILGCTYASVVNQQIKAILATHEISNGIFDALKVLEVQLEEVKTCFLSHHALTMSLMPLLVAAAQTSGRMDRVRIVNVASDMAFRMGPEAINYQDPNLTDVTGQLASWRRYGHFKQASIFAAKAITERYQPLDVTAYSLHPGLIKSGLQSHSNNIFGAMTRVAMKVGPTSTPLEGSMNSLFCATTSQAYEHAGRYYVPVQKLDDRANKWLDDPQAVGRLWDLANKQLKEHGFVFENLPRYYA